MHVCLHFVFKCCFLSCRKGLAFLLLVMQGKRNIAFMQELQCLFALMLGTRRKFVDPSAALELLRDAFRSAEEQQVKPRYKAFCFFFRPALANRNSVSLHPLIFRELFTCWSADKQLSLCHLGEMHALSS